MGSRASWDWIRLSIPCLWQTPRLLLPGQGDRTWPGFLLLVDVIVVVAVVVVVIIIVAVVHDVHVVSPSTVWLVWFFYLDFSKGYPIGRSKG